MIQMSYFTFIYSEWIFLSHSLMCVIHLFTVQSYVLRGWSVIYETRLFPIKTKDYQANRLRLFAKYSVVFEKVLNRTCITVIMQ